MTTKVRLCTLWTLGSLLLLALFMGRYEIGVQAIFQSFARLPEVLYCLASRSPLPEDLTPEQQVFLLLRLPRIVLALLIGAGLALSGAVYQGVFRNPLVSPDILGVTSGCVFGAALGLLWPQGGWLWVQACALLFGLAAAFASMTIAARLGQGSLLLLIMTGIIVGSMFSAGLMILKTLADPYGELPAIVFWLMGSLSAASWSNVAQVLPLALFGYALFHLYRYRLNVLCLGDRPSQSLGLDPVKLRYGLIAMASCVVAACVASVGQIAWIGLVIPHMVRTFTGSDHLSLIPLSTLFGGAFLLLSDSFARSAFAVEVPVGIVTSLIGAPLFAYLLFRRQSQGGHHA
ncbi:iron ABC transporter permease [Ferrimonas pelagia]|uniref:Iron ABC transporter permease n=1 Tax=Ferrimonas pelagia TaxID=1177826 RepID=A0ABP9EEY9_9GAMM